MKIIRRQFNKAMTYLVVSNEHDQEEFVLSEEFLKIRNVSDEGFEELFSPVNEFFKELPKQVCWKLMYIYKEAADEINTSPDSHQVVIDKITKKFKDLFEEHMLFDKLTSFVVFSSLSEFCKNWYYNAENNNKEDENITELTDSDLIAIMSVTILSKMLFPIWSLLKIKRLNGLKEYQIPSSNMLTTILENSKFNTAFEKLKVVVNQYGNRWWNKNINEKPLDFDEIVEDSCNFVFATLWTKRQVVFDSTIQNGIAGNIAVWLVTCTKHSFNSLIGEYKRKKNFENIPV